MCYHKSMILGFTLGRSGTLSFTERIASYKELGCNAIELSLINAEDKKRWADVRALTPQTIDSFEHVSLHAPAKDFIYAHDDSTRYVLEEIQGLYKKLHFKYAIIHPDRVKDWEVFKDYSFPIATENMDDRKEVGKTVESLRSILSNTDMSLVLDMNHCYVNDRSLNLAAEIYSAFRDRIAQIHLSGFKELHDPLYETKQLDVIKAIPDKNLPIIIESPCPTADVIKAEYEYIKANL